MLVLRAVKNTIVLSLAALAAMLWAPLAAQEGGRLKTLPLGYYECALPGDAGGLAWKPLPEHSFTIVNASGYRTDNGRGTYLLTGKELVFTRGPMQGQRFRRTGSRSLRALAPHEGGRVVRCVRRGDSD